MPNNPPKVIRTLEDCLVLLEGLLSSLGLDLSPEGTFEERVERVWAFLVETVPTKSLIVRPDRTVERLYA